MFTHNGYKKKVQNIQILYFLNMFSVSIYMLLLNQYSECDMEESSAV